MGVVCRAAVLGTALLFIAGLQAQERPEEAALLRAIQQSDLKAVKASLAAGADVNAKDRSGATPLMQAALYSDAACMRLLVSKGAAVSAANNAGATALMWSAGDPEKIRLLLASGADVNAVAKSGRTPLIIAASHGGNVEGVGLLLAKGADVKVKDATTGGAVYSAASAGDEAILRILLAAGGNPNTRNRFGVTPLIAACLVGSIEAAKVLVDAGANVNDQSGRREPVKTGLQELGELTPLLVAAAGGNAQLVKLLLDRGADVKARDMRGMTPLLMAASSEMQDAETVRLLIAKGSDVNAKANDGETAITWASKWGNNGVLRLVQQPSDASIQLASGKVLDAPREASMRAAIERTIALLQSSSVEYFAKSGCVGCHHQPLTAMAVSLARERGLKVNEALAKEQVRSMAAVRMPDREGLLQGVSRGGAPMSDTLLLVSLAAQGHPADSLTAALAHSAAGMQSHDGAWRSHTVRQPIEYSPFAETAYAVRALQLYGPPGRKAEYAKRIERARKWLESQSPVFNEDRAKRLLGLAWSGAKPGVTRAAKEQLLAEQQPDGGWAQRPGFPSDAYATGQTLFALNQAAGIRQQEAAYQKGVRYLRNTQLEDGSWHVRSRSLKFQPYFDSGFPHEHDQWISVAASAWAAMALTLAAEPPAVALR